MILQRIKNYIMIILLYGCSLYHFVFSFMAKFISGGNDSIIESLGMQVGRLRTSLLPVYGFETFTLMTCFIVFDYWLIRSPSYPKMNMRQFLDAFLFSQLAYVGYILQFKNEIIGINAFASGVWFFVIYLPMFFITFPLSLFLFKKRIGRIMSCQEEENIRKEQEKRNEDGENRGLIIDYLIVWFIAFVGAVIAYWLNHNKVIY